MKRSTLLLLAAMMVVVLAGAAAPQVDRYLVRNRIEGTWEHVFPNNPDLRQIKVINQTHFIWVTYHKPSRLPVAVAGGTYTLDGKTYKEQMEFGRFGIPKLQEAVGHEQTFQVSIDGDTLILSGTMSTGNYIQERWTRVKP